VRQPNSGEMHFAERLFATELKARRSRPPAIWPMLFDVAVMTSFLYFLLM
jgi:hypothetical protein